MAAAALLIGKPPKQGPVRQQGVDRGDTNCSELHISHSDSSWSLLFASLALAQIPESYGLDLGIPSPLNPNTGSHLAAGRGEVFDREALRQTKSFCVDARHIEDSEAEEVKEFMRQEANEGNC